MSNRRPPAVRPITLRQTAPTQGSLFVLSAGLLLAAFWLGWQAWL
ncbi:hypothetical protein VX159_05250 [Dechloromonas sp. ZY10]